MIGLIDFLTVAGSPFNIQNTKIHLAGWNGHEHPIDVYYSGRFQEWQEQQTKRNFTCDHIVSLIDIGQSRWLFVGVFDVIKCDPHPTKPTQYMYTTQLRPRLDDIIGRVIVEHVRKARAPYIWLTPTINLPIIEMRNKKMTVGDFPGYNSILIGHITLQIITQQVIPTWHAALKNIRGIYLITDTSTGKHYVGKASGEVGIWQRWCSYAVTGHGGNVKLKAILAELGTEHRNHFQYSILEIADTHASEQDILARESYWMNVLKTREYGLN